MTKALKVLAECVDVRSGKRYLPGDTFDPAPNPEQAARLVKAHCLPEAALAAAAKAETEAEKAAEANAAKARREAESLAKAQQKAKDEAAKRLADAKARGNGNLDPAVGQSTQIGDELFDLSDEDLAAVVAAEDVNFDDGADKAGIIAAIRAKRAAA